MSEKSREFELRELALTAVTRPDLTNLGSQCYLGFFGWFALDT